VINDQPWPFVLHEVAGSLLRRMSTRHHRAERIEVTFGPGAFEVLGRDLLRTITSVTTFESVPVTFPEKPAILAEVINLRAMGESGEHWAAVPALAVAAALIR
jgi:hypothetical protein